MLRWGLRLVTWRALRETVLSISHASLYVRIDFPYNYRRGPKYSTVEGVTELGFPVLSPESVPHCGATFCATTLGSKWFVRIIWKIGRVLIRPICRFLQVSSAAQSLLYKCNTCVQ